MFTPVIPQTLKWNLGGGREEEPGRVIECREMLAHPPYARKAALFMQKTRLLGKFKDLTKTPRKLWDGIASQEENNATEKGEGRGKISRILHAHATNQVSARVFTLNTRVDGQFLYIDKPHIGLSGWRSSLIGENRIESYIVKGRNHVWSLNGYQAKSGSIWFRIFAWTGADRECPPKKQQWETMIVYLCINEMNSMHCLIHLRPQLPFLPNNAASNITPFFK